MSLFSPGIPIQMPASAPADLHLFGRLAPDGAWASIDFINSPAPSGAMSWEDACHHPWTPWVSTSGVTEWDKAVWSALLNIPRGQTRTYTQIAQILKAPQSQRAVARACARNRWALIIPCHRVVGLNDKGGYKWGVAVKKSLLAWERESQEKESPGREGQEKESSQATEPAEMDF